MRPRRMRFVKKIPVFLIHKNNNELKDKIKQLGLNEFGKEVIYTCNDNNVIIDMSHIGEKSF